MNFIRGSNNQKKVEITSKKAAQEDTKILTMPNATISSKSGEILIPLRDAIAALGKKISWDSKTNTLTVTGEIEY